MTLDRLSLIDCLVPDWHRASVSPALPGADVSSRVRALITTRDGGVSVPPYGRVRAGIAQPGGLNLGLHTGDDPAAVAQNRARLQALTGGAPAAWLQQVHGTEVVRADEVIARMADAAEPPHADASVTDQPDTVCVVMVADCLPILLCDTAGRAVGAAHAGWRGLAAGVVENAAQQVRALAGATAAVKAFLGPAIGPRAFEVGGEVRAAFVDAATPSEQAATVAAFCARDGVPGKYWADLYALARLRLARVDITAVSGGNACTVTDAERFYSYRRESVTGRMAALIWLADQA
jgi:YfiH family protein